jgi:hypothetical protein
MTKNTMKNEVKLEQIEENKNSMIIRVLSSVI